MQKQKYGFVFGLIGFLAAVLVTASSGRCELTPEQKKLNLESFEYVWATINEKHFDTTFGGLDWPAVRDELKPKVEAAESMEDVREVLRDMVGRLGLSHFGIIPADLYNNIDGPPKKGDAGGQTGIEARVTDGKAVVTHVTAESPADAAGIIPGWWIDAIGDEAIEPVLSAIAEKAKDDKRLDYYLVRAVIRRLSGSVGDSLTITFTDGIGQTVIKTLELTAPNGKKAVFGNLPPFYLTIEVDTLEAGIGYFAFNCFFDPTTLMSSFNKAMKSFMTAPGLIIDLRGNPGGIGAIAMGMSGWLIDEKNYYLGTLSTRDTELKLIVNPRAKTFSGPVAILVDALSGSSAEFLAGGLQDLGRAHIFGSRTVGAALPSAIEKLPNGDGFQYVFANYVSQSGRPLEGNGVIPDQSVTISREALLGGRDAVVDAAVEWIKSYHSELR
jgi:carboxyl-terminal processing protease